jgi:hypothetical protein
LSVSLEAEEAICAAGRTAPRVSLADIQAAIKHEFYSSGADIARLNPGAVPPLDILTVCVVVMHNGFTVIGKAAPASPENYDMQLGRDLARADAIRQIWPLMGFALRERLSAA